MRGGEVIRVTTLVVTEEMSVAVNTVRKVWFHQTFAVLCRKERSLLCMQCNPTSSVMMNNLSKIINVQLIIKLYLVTYVSFHFNVCKKKKILYSNNSSIYLSLRWVNVTLVINCQFLELRRIMHAWMISCFSDTAPIYDTF